MEATNAEVWAFVTKKYNVTSYPGGGGKYYVYHTPGSPKWLWGYEIVEAVAVIWPLPANVERPKLLEVGRKVRVKHELENTCKIFRICFAFVLYLFSFRRCHNNEVHS